MLIKYSFFSTYLRDYWGIILMVSHLSYVDRNGKLIKIKCDVVD